MDKGIPTREEWNALSRDEQEERILGWAEHTNQWIQEGIPISMGDLRNLANEYGTPVPIRRENGELDFSGYDLIS